MNKSIFIALLAVWTLQGCGSSKNKGADVPKQASMTDFAYIQKFHEGVRLKSRGQTLEAITAFENCLSMRQNDDAVYFALSTLYLAQGEKAKAGDCILKASKLDPKNLYYTTELAYFYYEEQKFTEAIACFQKMVKQEPRNPDFQYGLAESYMRAGKPQEAINALNKTQDQMGVVPELSIQKFNLYLQLKNNEKALNELEEARKAYPGDSQLLSTLVDYYFRVNQEAKAIQTLEELAVSDPQNGRVHLFLADIYRQKGQKDRYFASLEKGFKGEGVDLNQKMQVLIGMQDRREDTDPRALELVNLLVMQHPTEAKSHTIQADFLMALGREKEALSSYRKALDFEKGAYAIWNQVLVMEYQSEEYEALYLDSKRCLNFFPTVATVNLLNGIAAIQLKNYQEGIATLESGKEFVINDKPLLAEFYGQIADGYFGLKKYAEGQSNYENAMRQDPQSNLLQNNYAYRLALAKIELDKAESLVKKVNENSPNQPHFVDTYGWVLFQKGNYSAALTKFQKAYELNPKDRIIVEHLGDVLLQLDRKKEGVEYLKKAKELGSTNKNLDLKIEKQTYYDPIY